MRAPAAVSLVFFLSSCMWFPNRDSKQPLVSPNTEKPSVAVLAQAATVLSVDSKNMADSLGEARSAARGWSITGYADFSAYLNMQSLVTAANEWDQNAYAYFLLASYLAVNYRTKAALMANERASALLKEQLSKGIPAGLYPADLPPLLELNLARYQLLAGEFLQARITVDDLRANPTLDPLLQLAAAWIQIEALIGTQELDEAEATLKASRDIHLPEDSPHQGWSDEYPPYFNQRSQYESYLEGLIRLAAGNLRAAKNSLTVALRGDRGLYEATFSLALTEADLGNLPRSIELLKGLNQNLPGVPDCGLLRRGNFRGRERIAFNQAVLEDRYGDEGSAVEDYRRAIKISKCTIKQFNDDVARNIVLGVRYCRAEHHSEEFCHLIELARDEQGVDDFVGSFPEAQNNLGQLLVRKLERQNRLSPAARRTTVDDARKALESAMNDPRYSSPQLPIRGLVRLDLLMQDPSVNEVLELGQRAVQWDADNEDLARLIVKVVLADNQPEVRARGYNLLAAIAAGLPASVKVPLADTPWKSGLTSLNIPHDTDESLAILLVATGETSAPELRETLIRNDTQTWARAIEGLLATDGTAAPDWQRISAASEQTANEIRGHPRDQRGVADLATLRLADRVRTIASQH
jgi:hypothetical protein